MKAHYTTFGPVRGFCHHSHRTIAAAQACASKDSAYCRSLGGGSDRSVVAIDEEGFRRDLTDDELLELHRITDNK